jgi:hypothetical protein
LICADSATPETVKVSPSRTVRLEPTPKPLSASAWFTVNSVEVDGQVPDVSRNRPSTSGDSVSTS